MEDTARKASKAASADRKADGAHDVEPRFSDFIARAITAGALHPGRWPHEECTREDAMEAVDALVALPKFFCDADLLMAILSVFDLSPEDVRPLLIGLRHGRDIERMAARRQQ